MLKREKNRGALGFFFRNSNILLLVSCLMTSVYGCLLVYSSIMNGDGSFRSCIVQMVCSAVGFLFALFISRVDYNDICRLWFVWVGFAGLLVLLTFTPLGINVSGTDDTAWLGFPFSNPKITFQPSELLKIAFIISFAIHLDKAKDSGINRFANVLLLCAHGGLATGLIFLQGDDGTALVFILIFLSMMFVAGLHWGYFLAAFGAVAAVVPIFWKHMDAQKMDRIKAIFYVDQYLQTEGWQQSAGLSAIGSGRLYGVGYMQGGNQGLFARSNDFIFSVAGEEFGFIGAVFVLLCLMLIVIAITRTALQTNDPKGKLICVGMAALVGFQSLINIGMVLRLLPVIGITLPFFSAGGSSVATLYLGIGLCLSVHYTNKTHTIRKG